MSNDNTLDVTLDLLTAERAALFTALRRVDVDLAAATADARRRTTARNAAATAAARLADMTATPYVRAVRAAAAATAAATAPVVGAGLGGVP